MSLKETLMQRSGGKCELCQGVDNLETFEVEGSGVDFEKSILLCGVCREQIENQDILDQSHWHCLNESMWSEIPAVVVMSYRLLKRLGNQDLLDMLYMDEDLKKWADEEDSSEGVEPTKDTNGTVLNAGDSVTIIKDLEVKGAGFTAKRGTVVKNISLTDNPEQIEGRVNSTRIVLLTKFLKKV